MQRRALLLALVAWVVVGCAAATPLPPTDSPVADTRPADHTASTTAILVTATPVSADLIAQVAALQTLHMNVYERVAPSVVNIETRKPALRPGEVTGGSGFVLDSEGIVVTNAHVVDSATDIYVTFNDGYLTTGKLLGLDRFSDLAVVQVNVDRGRLIPVTLGDSDSLRVGQWVLTIGNPYGLLSSMTTGIISATSRILDSSLMLNPTSSERFSNPSIIQIDAYLNPGNSGGPLLDINGLVIGINTAIRTESGAFQGIGFAVPVNTMKRVVPQLVATGRVRYSWLGINASDRFTVASLVDDLKLPVDYGVLVTTVTDGSPAAIAGLRGGTQLITVRGEDLLVGGDIIIALNDLRIRDMDQLLSYLVANTTPGDALKVTYIRDGATYAVTVTLAERPAN